MALFVYSTKLEKLEESPRRLHWQIARISLLIYRTWSYIIF
jgi:hypothetical protein